MVIESILAAAGPALASGGGALAGQLLKGGSKSKKTQSPIDTSFSRQGTTTTTRTPGIEALPAEERALFQNAEGIASDIASGNRTPTETAAGPSPLQVQGFQAASGISPTTPLIDEANQQLIAEFNRGVDPSQLPGFQGALDAAIRPLQQARDEALRNAKLRASSFGAAGTPNELMLFQGIERDFINGLNDITANLTFPAALQMLQNRLTAFGLVPQLANLDLPRITAMLQAGGEQRQIAQEQLQAAFRTARARNIEDPLRGLQSMFQALQLALNSPAASTTTSENIQGRGFQGPITTTGSNFDPNQALSSLTNFAGPSGPLPSVSAGFEDLLKLLGGGNQTNFPLPAVP